MISIRQFFVFGAALLCGIAAVPAYSAEWSCGVAKVVITPTEPVWLSGYSSRDHAAEGKVHDLYAKAVAFESQEGKRLVAVTCDLGSISPEISETVAAEVEKQRKLPRESLVFNVSHTHCAPEVAAERLVFHDLKPEEERKLATYIERELIPNLTKLVVNAIDDLKPAKLFISQASAEFGKNRRFPTADGFTNQPYEQGVSDHDVPVMKVVGEDDAVRAVLFGYACHNTTLAFYQFCGDYAGFAQYDVEAAHPGTVALFVMGCGGDQNPYPRHGERGLEYCKQHGRELADAVERALEGEQHEVHGPLRLAYEVISLELEPLPAIEELRAQADGLPGHPRRKARYLFDRLERDGTIELAQRCPLQVARFGDDLLWLFVSGETVVDYSRKPKVEFTGPMVWVAGYCNDVFAYLPSLRVLQEGGYEGRTGIVHQLTPTPFAISVEDRVMGGLRKLVKQVSE